MFLGNFISSLNETHFKNLNIRKILGLTPNKIEKIDESTQIDKYVHLEINEMLKPQLDFVEILNIVNELMQEGEGAVLIYCLQGNLSAAVCMKLLMETKHTSREIAAAMIMTKRPEARDIPSWLFMQLDPPDIK